MASALDENSVQMSCDSNECETVPNITEQHLQNGYEPLFEVEEDEDCGRFLVAKQKINQGQVILFEKPTGKLVIILRVYNCRITTED
jgi:hypothetical protein